MAKRDKLLQRLKSNPKDFTWDEAVSLMKQAGYEVLNGKGSRRKFFKAETGRVVILHEPHPSNILKPYMVEVLKSALDE